MTTSQTTAYAHNTRASRPMRDRPAGASTRARLEAADHVVANVGFTGEGVLYRGIVPFTTLGIVSGELTPNGRSHSLCVLENELGVLLVSNELSDAVTVARPFVAGRDAAIAIIPAGAFAWRAAAGEAGVLSFAEPGVVFRYPFLAQSVQFSELVSVFVHRAFLTRLRVRRAFREVVPFHFGDVSLAVSDGQLIPIIGIDADTRKAFTDAVEVALTRVAAFSARWA